MQRIAFAAGIAGFLLAPLAALAAYNDVTLTVGSTQLSVNGVTLDVAVSNALLSQIAVSANSFTLTLNAGSKMSVTSTDRRALTISDSGSTAQTATVCTSNISEADVSSTVTDTVTVTVGSGTCTLSTAAPGGGSSGGGGGGGGGGGAVAATTPVVTTPVVTTAASVTPTSAAAPSVQKFATLSIALKRGAISGQAKTLQQMLNQDPDTRVALSGAGSVGHETTFFGPATLVAIKKFQVKWSIAKSGDLGYGNLGPLTRAKLNSLYH